MKLLKWALLIAVLGSLIWYFFIKEYDYQISFQANTTIGTVNQSIKSWNTSLENPQPIQQISESELLQIIQKNDSIYTYLWKLENTENTVNVTAYVKSNFNNFKTRFLIPFTETNFENTTTNTVKAFLSNLNAHLKEIKITIEGEENSPNSFAACVSIETIQIKKAKGMMANFSLLSGFISDSGLEPNGRPFLEITNWNRDNDSIAYNFCFPFKVTDSLPKNSLVTIREVNSKKSLKASYNGNYITSDRAWYALEAYARQQNIAIDMHPIEVFHNNPNMGGDELQWTTDVYIPIKED